jgi:hypothetical protein
MNIPIITRIREMFVKDTHHCSIEDKLVSYVFSFIKDENTYENDWFASLEVLDIIEECKTYIYRDRILQINASIEAELNGDTETSDDLLRNIHQQDTAVMIDIIKIRQHLL